MKIQNHFVKIATLFLILFLLLPVQAAEEQKLKIIPAKDSGNHEKTQKMDVAQNNQFSYLGVKTEKAEEPEEPAENESKDSPFPDPLNSRSSNSSENKSTEDSLAKQAGKDMITGALTEDIPRKVGDMIYEQYGGTRAFIYRFYTENLKPWDIPILKDFYQKNWRLVLPCSMLFIMGATISRSVASANPEAFYNVFGRKDWAHNDSIAGGLFMIIGMAFGAFVYALMLILDLINAYLMLFIMDSIEPSMDNALMYCAMALISVALFVFFIYRQMWIAAGYVFSPFYGVLFATGCMKDLIDDIGEKYLRAIGMQPLSLAITVFWLAVIKAFGLDGLVLPYLVLFIILLAGCWYCTFGKFTFIKRAVSKLIVKKVF